MANPHIIIHLTPVRHRKLKKAAKRSKLSLSQYVSAIIPWEALPEIQSDQSKEETGMYNDIRENPLSGGTGSD